MGPNSLISLVSDQLDLFKRVLDNEGEVADDLELAIRENHAALAHKVDSYADILDELDFRAEFLRNKAQALTSAAKTMESKAEFLRERLRLSLAVTGKPLTGNEIEFGLGKPSISVDLKEGVFVEELPKDFIRIKCELDKTVVKEKWEGMQPELQEKFVRTEKPRLLQRARTPLRKKS